jgi:hypothetical protein
VALEENKIGVANISRGFGTWMTFGSVLLGETVLYLHETRESPRNAVVFHSFARSTTRWSALLICHQEADYQHVIVGSHHHIFSRLQNLGNYVQSLAKLHCKPQNLFDVADVGSVRRHPIHLMFLTFGRRIV